METQKIVTLLNKNDVDPQKFATRKWYVINDLSTNNKYGGKDNTNPSSIKFETKTLKSNLCDYSDAYILVTGKISINQAANCVVAFKNCAQCTNCTVKINDDHIETAENLEVVMPM